MVLLTGVYSFLLYCVICLLHGDNVDATSDKIVCPDSKCELAINPFDITQNDALDGLKNSKNFETKSGDMFKDISDDSNIKKVSEIHDSGFYTSLCWIEITTITETKNGSKSAIREYAITFETPSDIPDKYVNNKTKIDGEESVQYKIFDRDTKKSEIVNFTTISRSEDNVVRQNRKILCGSGPIYTKEFMEWPHSERKRVEIRVSPKKQNLIATDCVGLKANIPKFSTSLPTRKDFTGEALDDNAPTASDEIKSSKALTPSTFSQPTADSSRERTMLSEEPPEVTTKHKTADEKHPTSHFKTIKTTPPTKAETEVTSEKPEKEMRGVTKVISALHATRKTSNKQTPGTLQSKVKYGTVDSTRSSIRPQPTQIATTTTKSPLNPLVEDESKQEVIISTEKTKHSHIASGMPHKIGDESKPTEKTPSVKYNSKSILESPSTKGNLFTGDGSSLTSTTKQTPQEKLQNKHTTITPEGTSKMYPHIVGHVPSQTSSHAKKLLVPNRKANQHKNLFTSTTEVISDITIPTNSKTLKNKASSIPHQTLKTPIDKSVTTLPQNTLKDESMGADGENIKVTDLKSSPFGHATTTESVNKIPNLKEKTGDDDDVEYYYFDFTEPPIEENAMQGGDKAQIQTTAIPTMKPKVGDRSTPAVSLPTTLLEQEESTKSHVPLVGDTFNTLRTEESDQSKTTLNQYVTSKSAETHLKDNIHTEEYTPDITTITGKVPADEGVSQIMEHSTAVYLDSGSTEVPPGEDIKIIKGKHKIHKFAGKEQSTEGKYTHRSTERTSFRTTSVYSKKGKVDHKQTPTEINIKKVDDNGALDKNIRSTTETSSNKLTTLSYQSSVKLDQKFKEPEGMVTKSSETTSHITTQEVDSSSSTAPDTAKLLKPAKVKEQDNQKSIDSSSTTRPRSTTTKANFKYTSTHKQGHVKDTNRVTSTTSRSDAGALELIMHGKSKHVEKGVTVPAKETSTHLLNKNAESTTSPEKVNRVTTTEHEESTSRVSIKKISSKQYTTDASKPTVKGASTEIITEKPLQDQTENVKQGMFTLVGVKKHHKDGRHSTTGHRGGMKSTTIKPSRTTDTTEAIYLQSSPHISEGRPTILSDNLKQAFRTTDLVTEEPAGVTTEADQSMQSLITELPYPENYDEKHESNVFDSEGEKTEETTTSYYQPEKTSHFTTSSPKKPRVSTTKRSKSLEHGISTTTIQSFDKYSGQDVEVSRDVSTDTKAPPQVPLRKASTLQKQSSSPKSSGNIKSTSETVASGSLFGSATTSTISPVSRTSPHSRKYSTSSSGYITTEVPSRARSSKINILSSVTKKPKTLFGSLKPEKDVGKSSTLQSIVTNSHRSSTETYVMPKIKSTSKQHGISKETLQTSTSRSIAGQSFSTESDMDVATIKTTGSKFPTSDDVTKEPSEEKITNIFSELLSKKPPTFKSRGKPADSGTTESSEFLNPLREFDYLCNTTQQRVLVKVKLMMEHVLAVNKNGSEYEQAIPVIGLEKKTEFDINPLPDDEEDSVSSEELSEHWEQFLDDLTKNFFSTNRDKIPKYNDLPSRTLNISAPEYDFKEPDVSATESFKRMQSIKNSMRRCSNHTFENSKFVANPQFRIDNLFAPIQEKHATFTTTLQNLQKRIEVQHPQENPDFYKFLLGLQPSESTKQESSYDSMNVAPTRGSYLSGKDSSGNGFNSWLQGRDHIINRENYGYTPMYGRYRDHQPILYTNAFAFPQRVSTFDSLPSNEHPILGFKPKAYQPNTPIRGRNDYSFLKHFGPQPPPLNHDVLPNVAPKSVYYEGLTTTKFNPNMFMGLNSASGYGINIKRQTTEPKINILKETGKMMVPKLEANEEISYNTGSVAPLFVPQDKIKQVRQSISPSHEKYAAFRWEDVEAANRALFNITDKGPKSESVTSSALDFSTILSTIVNKLSSLLNKLSTR